MGFYLRKSITVGPFRFNLSNSGVGVSVGVRGFRVGTGPRGNYVHLGAGGIYYRASLPSGPRNSEVAQQFDSVTHAPFEAVTSDCVSRMVDSSSRALLAEIDAN